MGSQVRYFFFKSGAELLVGGLTKPTGRVQTASHRLQLESIPEVDPTSVIYQVAVLKPVSKGGLRPVADPNSEAWALFGIPPSSKMKFGMID